MREIREKKYYRIRVWLFWLMIGGFAVLLLGVYFKDELYEKWLRSGEFFEDFLKIFDLDFG